MRVLVVDDEEAARLLLAQVVIGAGHDCVTCPDGETAWALVQAGGIDVVVTDWEMPNVDGVELTRRIRGRDHVAFSFVILVTARDARRDLRDGLLAGADDYLAKPVGFTDLEMRLILAERVVNLHRNLADRKRDLEVAREVSERLARLDGLTELGNRLRLREDTEALQARIDRYGHRCAVALLDVDHFKSFNDTYGHLAGDDALRSVGQVIQRQLRSGDQAYRYGGEEFLVVLAEQDQQRAAVAVERIRRAVEALGVPHAFGVGGRLTVSAGVAEAGVPGDGGFDLAVSRADAALYLAKSRGRNCVELAAATLDAEEEVAALFGQPGIGRP